jgi:glutathione-regulated potassium-efflux system ancillary protein KefG
LYLAENFSPLQAFMKILILFGHPAFQKSTVNKLLIEGFNHMSNITFHDLYQEYPDNYIDVKREQQLLLEHDVIIFQFPFFWFSTPPIFKEWQDVVLEHDWAFGSKGNQLKGKVFFCSITAGGSRSLYCEEAVNHHTMNQFLFPIHQTASLCKMIPLPPFVVHGTHDINLEDIKQHKILLNSLLNQLSIDKLDFSEAIKYEYLNDYISKRNQ